MQAPYELTDGLKRLQAIITSFPIDSPHWNEAQNRFQFVDRLLTECLGWEKPSIEVEHTDELGGRSDYYMGKPAKAILEAKREAKYFDVPPSGSRTLVRKMDSLLKSSEEFEVAVKQVIPYCAINGAQVAIVCNGPQLAIFQAITPGESPLKGECFFFDGFGSYIENFPLLWKLLSPEGITENTAYRDLARHRNPRIPAKASTAIVEPLKYRYRTPFQENLRELSSLLLEEIEDNPSLKRSFYQECYVPIDANNRHMLLSKNIIEMRYRRAGEGAVAPNTLDAKSDLNKEGHLEFTDPTLKGDLLSRPIVVIGDIGVGKSSFFENLYENLDAKNKANTYFIHINLGIKANLSADIKSYVLSEIPLFLKTHYNVDIESDDFVNAIYHQELIDFDKGIAGRLKGIDNNTYQIERFHFLKRKMERRDAHLELSLAHLVRGRNKQIILVIDNADQRTFQVQQEAFLIAQELAALRAMIVFVALRPSSLYVSKTTGALSAYQNKILTISPPPADQVVEKRLVYAALVAEGKITPAGLEGIRLNLGNVASFLKVTLRSIRNGEDIRRFLGNIAGGNTRAVIELVTAFFGSPNVDSKKIIEIEEKKGKYHIPLHEFTKHALLGEYAYFNSQSSYVACNIYDVSTADPREHFLKALIVAFLSSNLGVVDSDGFIKGQTILEEMRRQRFVDEQIRDALMRLASKKLIETPHAHYREIPVDSKVLPEEFHFRATSVGIYHVRYWAGSFSFLDAVSTDTPIFDETARDALFRVASTLEIQERYSRTISFRDYLLTKWNLSNVTSTYFDFADVLSSQQDSFEKVKAVLERWGLTH